VEADRDRGGRAARWRGWIAWGLLKVGAGQRGAPDPGPGLLWSGAGQEPTVTDADLLLGYLDADFFLGGQDATRRGGRPAGRSRRAVAQPMGLSVTEAAWGIHRVVNENMGGRRPACNGIERAARDLRGYPLFAFGGAGSGARLAGWPHSLRVAARCSYPTARGRALRLRAAGPPRSRSIFVRTAPQRLTAADWELINRLFQEMEAEGRRILRGAGVPDAEVTVRRSAEMRYFGQGHEGGTWEIPTGILTEASPGAHHVLVSRRPIGLLYSRTPMGGAARGLELGARSHLRPFAGPDHHE